MYLHENILKGQPRTSIWPRTAPHLIEGLHPRVAHLRCHSWNARVPTGMNWTRSNWHV